MRRVRGDVHFAIVVAADLLPEPKEDVTKGRCDGATGADTDDSDSDVCEMYAAIRGRGVGRFRLKASDKHCDAQKVDEAEARHSGRGRLDHRSRAVFVLFLVRL